MRFNRRRRGGTVFNIILLVIVLFLVTSISWYVIQGLANHPGGGGGDHTTTSTTTAGTSSTSNTSSGTSTTTTATDNMSLAQLQTLTFANTTKCDGVLDQKFWDSAIQSSGKTIVTIIPNTAYGLIASYNGWTSDFQSTTNAPAWWLPGGLENYATNFVTNLGAQIIGTHDATQAAGMLRNFTASVSGLRATAADFLTLGSLSGIKVYGETGNITQTAEATFPGQIYQLFTLSQDCSYSEEQRGQFFGTAMAMSLFILATSGKDGFGPKFEALLTKLGLRDAWPRVKGYLKDISDTSPGAAYETTLVLAALAKKFPTGKFTDLASFASSRITVMVKVLKEKGLSAVEIEQKVAQLTKAVEESEEEGHVADVADKISYDYEGSLRVTVDSDYVAVLFSQGGRRSITAAFLTSILPGFKVGEVTALKVTVHKLWMELPSYHVYEGGKYVGFELPDKEVQPGDAVGLSFELLPVNDFARQIPDFVVSNSASLKWLGDGAVLKDFKVVDGVLEFRVLQKNQWSSIQEFTVKGEIVKYPGESVQYGGVYAQFSIKDYAGRTRDLRIRYDGFSSVGLQLIDKDSSRPISLISYDGFRLSVVYDSDNSVATIYIESPSESIYSLGAMHTYSGPFLKLVQGRYTNAWQVDNVVMLRDLEKAMLDDGTTYDRGRLGAEIAYVAGDKLLGLKSMIIEEPSVGGRDLYTQDNTVAIQARFLKNLGSDKETAIQQALFDLADKLQKDYKYQQPQMQDGYAILSYVDTDGTVKTIILEVPKW